MRAALAFSFTAWPAALRLTLASSLASAALLGLALHATPLRSDASAHEHALLSTPERSAENLIAAYTRGDYEQAAHFASGALARKLRMLAREKRMGAHAEPGRERALLIEESFFLTQGRLRLAGVAALDGAAHDDWPVSLVMAREGDEFLAEELTWPKLPEATP